MENFIHVLELWPYFLMAIVGALAHILKKWAKLERKDRTLDVGKWLKDHKWRTILGLFVSCGSVVMLDQSGGLTMAAALLLGYTGDSLLKKEKK